MKTKYYKVDYMDLILLNMLASFSGAFFFVLVYFIYFHNLLLYKLGLKMFIMVFLGAFCMWGALTGMLTILLKDAKLNKTLLK